MTRDIPWYVWVLSGLVILHVFKKPIFDSIYGAYDTPKFEATLKQTILSRDAAKIAQLRQVYESAPFEVRDRLDQTFRKLGLRRPW